MIPVRVPPDAAVYVVGTPRPLHQDHPLLSAADCPVCAQELGDAPVALVYLGTRPQDRRPEGYMTGMAVPVHAACAGPARVSAAERATGQCRSCRAPVLWAVTTAGKPMPLDPEPHQEGNVGAYTDATGRVRARVLSGERPSLEHHEQRYMPHFATCPNYSRGRR